MSNISILAWQPLLRPPLPDEEPPAVPDVPLKALTCRNAITSVAALVTSDEPVEDARIVFSDLIGPEGRIPASAIAVRVVGVVPTPEAGVVCDPLFEVDEFDVDKAAALYANITIPGGIPAGTYTGTVEVVVNELTAAQNSVEVEVAAVDLPDVHDWSFVMNVWMNPATIAYRHCVDVWSDKHFALLKPYIQDLAAHGQKTAVVPICFQPWGLQLRQPCASAVVWKRRGESWEFDFTAFDTYIALHHECGIDRAIHCYSPVQSPGCSGQSIIEYIDLDTGKKGHMVLQAGDDEYKQVWSAFLVALKKHLEEKSWLNKTYIAFNEKCDKVTQVLMTLIEEYAPDLKIAVTASETINVINRIDDLSVFGLFNDRGIAVMAPTERRAMGVADLLDPNNVCSITKRCPEKMTTTFYIASGPSHPNTFAFSPVVEARMLPFLAMQGGYDGILRWAYNDWPDDAYEDMQWVEPWAVSPSGDAYLVYPGEKGPVSSLRWEQLREGIQDFELAVIASSNMQTPDEMVDYEQAITLACRDIDGRVKSTGDIEIARRLLIPIAAHQSE
ncbi:MAG: DUF4091 domain-containing protein [Armatimonadota bacterium]|nr:DUF4091 domain-containing protein [bacterium]